MDRDIYYKHPKTGIIHSKNVWSTICALGDGRVPDEFDEWINEYMIEVEIEENDKIPSMLCIPEDKR